MDTLTLIVECVKAFLTSDDIWLSIHLPNMAADWPIVVSLAERHRVLPFVYKALTKNDSYGGLSAQTHQLLTQYYRWSIQRSLQLTAQTLRLLRQLEQAGIRALPLKGPLLALQLYGIPTLRSSNDIDVLIELETYPQVKALLRDLGYRYLLKSCEHWSSKQEILFLRHVGEISWIHSESSTILDLHIRWDQNPELHKLDFNQAWQDAMVLQITPQDAFRVLPVDHQLLYLSAHGAVSVWGRLLWITDIAALSLRQPDWEHLFHRAKKMDLLRPVGQALCLTQTLFSMKIPEPWFDLCQTAPYPYLTAMAMAAIQELEPVPIPSPFKKWRKLKYLSCLQERWLYKLRSASPVSLFDYELLPLPSCLFPVYFWLRPAFYVVRWLMSAKS